jgi:hypothetical protein
VIIELLQQEVATLTKIVAQQRGTIDAIEGVRAAQNEKRC